MRLYVISSPLQLINAIEARERFTHSGDDVLIYIYRKQADLDSVSGILDKQWADISYFGLSTFTRLFYPQLLRHLFKKNTIDRVYLGYPYNIRAHIANVCDVDTWLLDDGTFTLWLNEELSKPASELWQPPSIADRLLGRHVDLSYLHKVVFFTTYDIQPPQSQLVVRNDFSCIKRQIVAKLAGEEVLFIGTPVEGRMLSSLEDFLSAMKQVRAFYGQRKVVYALHRHEDEKMRRAQLEPLGISTVRFDTPLEVACYEREDAPFEIASFTSSALANLHDIYGFSARSFRVPEQALIKERKEIFNTLYADLEKRQIPITTLSELN
ncbi:MAG: alpha-2,8-polysialyltransferase family protein [Gammaproteobacteria bacterium]|nr:alpha-2,8-polysialyltransferase family protein [Gammaproteobacteria bacterium]